VLAAAVWAPSALAAAPAVTASASATSGYGPLAVTLSAAGDAASYHWELGDGASADGAGVRHTYAPGSWTATVTATATTGETSQAWVTINVRADTPSLRGPGRADWDAPVALKGRLPSGRARVRLQLYRGRTYVASASTRAGGAYAFRIRLRTPGRYHVRHGVLRSTQHGIVAIPRVVLTLPPTAALGDSIPVRAHVEPSWAGRLQARVDGKVVALSKRGGMRLGAPRAGTRTVGVRLLANPGFTVVRRSATTLVVVPELGLGSRGQAVRALEQRLRDQRYALRTVDGSYDLDTVEAVYAFQSVHGLAQTGRVDAGLWRLLARSGVPAARYPGTHIEVSKSRQFLLDVRSGLVVRVVHVSTGATGNTPLGTWHVYRTVPGYDWVLYYPLYFLRGFAVHGYPSVPPYPASHGCVRIPMWLATTIFSGHGLGTTIYVY
jgi:PKD repeat protein/lipoprotein-anchoring transpeptidase ErfK/SrfK